MKIVITGGLIIDPANDLEQPGHLYIAEGNIAAVGEPLADFTPDRVIDARGKWVCPGIVDLCARFREPGHEHKTTIAQEARAASAAGITTVCIPPDTEPVIDTPAVVEFIRHREHQAGLTRLVTLGALTQALAGEKLSAMAALQQAGCVGVSNAWAPVINTRVLRRALEYAATFGLTVHVHAQDHWLSRGGVAHEGLVATRLGLPGIPSSAETIETSRILGLVEQIGVRVHFCRLSTARAAQMIGRAQHDGLPVTADVCAHQLHLTEMDIADFNALCHVRPPLRTQRDRDGLRRATARGVIHAICSDHQPHEPDAKRQPFSASEPGISALETLLPLTLRLVDEKILSLRQAIARLTWGPAQTLGLAAGTLSPGRPADVIVLDPRHYWTVDDEQLVSQGKNSPFSGWELRGRVTHTVLGGKLVYQREPT